MEAIQRTILDFLADGDRRWTPCDLENAVRKRTGHSRRQIRAALRRLVEERRLDYTYLHGCSFIEASFNRPVPVGRHILLLPPGMQPAQAAGKAVIRLAQGAAFGNGRHPSTRLALQGIAHLLRSSGWHCAHGTAECLDIGTGSGVLALAALALGVRRAVGLDIDATSLFEAAANARLNGMAKRFEVMCADLCEVDATFDIVLANLRPPTLKAMLPDICRCLRKRGAVVLSGFRRGEEAVDLLGPYARRGMSCMWCGTEKGWQAFVLFMPGSASREP